VAAPIAKETGDRVGAAGGKRPAEDVEWGHRRKYRSGSGWGDSDRLVNCWRRLGARVGRRLCGADVIMLGARSRTSATRRSCASPRSPTFGKNRVPSQGPR
jgi:hypothetical protein